MDSMISTILTVKQLLQQRPPLKIGYLRAINTESTRKYTLPENRCYSIPGYQREIRWSTKNIQVLIEDLSDRCKFLGYILVSTYDDKTYQIIDGQQNT